ncbi:hypothetical protein [Neobacillus vireti]|uniref:hypothetical protein n=1 Tax=Neobacillus vireti TaxID=220686 RepID=UPI002FFE8464
MINWQYYPKTDLIPNHLYAVVNIFENKQNQIDSSKFTLPSNDVLAVIAEELEALHYQVEKSKREIDKIKVPVLFGRNGKLELYFEADAYHPIQKTVIEVEAGRAVDNFQFLKDLFQAAMMHDVEYLTIAVRTYYRKQKDFEKVTQFFDTLYASSRLKLPFKGILIIGY